MKELPRIVCQKCNMSQTYHGQLCCTSCGKRLNNWSVASQLALQKAVHKEQEE